MSYCVNCGVELEASLKNCPLCHTPVINPNQLSSYQEASPSPYPLSKGQVDVVKRKDLGILLGVVLSATSLTCLLLNLLVFSNSRWSLLVIGICICLFVFAFPAVIYTKTPIYLSLLADGAAVAVYLYLITYLTASADWFFGLGLPIVIVIFTLIEIFTLLIRRLSNGFLACALYFFTETAILCSAIELLIRNFMDRPLMITWSAVVMTVCVIIDFALITILLKKRLRNELRRRLHF